MIRIPIGIIVALALYGLYLGTKKAPLRDEQGNMVLRHNKLYFFIGAISIILMPIATSNILFSSYPETRDYLIGGFLCVIILLLGFFLILSYINERAVVGPVSIEYRNIFRNKINIDWKDIKAIRHNPSIKKLVLITDKSSIGINTSFIGFKAFTEELIKHIEPATYENIKGIL